MEAGEALDILVQSAGLWLSGARPHTSPLGIVSLAVTLITMLLPARGQRVIGRPLGNLVLSEEGKSCE